VNPLTTAVTSSDIEHDKQQQQQQQQQQSYPVHLDNTASFAL
jgi:hypothetical protein